MPALEVMKKVIRMRAAVLSVSRPAASRGLNPWPGSVTPRCECHGGVPPSQPEAGGGGGRTEGLRGNVTDEIVRMHFALGPEGQRHRRI